MTKIINYTLLIIVNLAILTNQIYIPLSGQGSRCMIIFSVGQTQTVKLDINFPELSEQLPHQRYEVSWKNTESNEVHIETIANGKYKKQLFLNQNIIYDLCMRVDTNRYYGTAYVEYNVHNLFSINQANIKIPQNLLKQGDLTLTYTHAVSIQKHLDAFIESQQEKATKHGEIFKNTNNINERMVQISLAEVLIIIAAGCYQYWAIWNFLKSRHQI